MGPSGVKWDQAVPIEAKWSKMAQKQGQMGTKGAIVRMVTVLVMVTILGLVIIMLDSCFP